MFITNLSSLLDRVVSLLTQHQEKSKQIDGDENKVSAEDDNEAEKIAKEEAPKVPPSLQPDEEIHPFAPTDHFVSPPVNVYNNYDSSNPNWLPGLPRPPPGVFIQPPRDRSRRERMRYLAQLNRSILITAFQSN